ncbi:uncharacterized protein NESG_01082 [Nematocida ausubeli]|uniref:Uncharacterized protein n=1 Tax=Nematocida ausubeli (strain ATCC PRA-371 / ERTm2) TaxID=1913371 RepID=A0A086J458_NEMA1|nr:uncharacterized protein NESG_01082 [Nematocida ausubeli]KFG26926.1 hypothetical protein NESG_01082 [Nematocida ausubeli]
MSEPKNTIIKNASGQRHRRHPQDSNNKTPWTTSLSILDYYLRTSSSPPFGHVKKNRQIIENIDVLIDIYTDRTNRRPI